MPRRALIVQHQEDAPPGLILDALRERGIDARIVRGDLEQPLPDPRAHAFVVALGSDKAAYATEPNWVGQEIGWLREADAAGTPVLGVCFGAQTLAMALGGSVQRASSPERGWIRLETGAPELVPAGPWLTWHDDAILPPPDSELIAENQAGPQAFTIRRHLGVQFHPEATLEILAGWVAADPGGSGAGEALLRDGARQVDRAREAAARLFAAFIRRAIEE